MNYQAFLKEFIEWLRDCGEDVFYVFDNPDEAVQKFLEHLDNEDSEA